MGNLDQSEIMQLAHEGRADDLLETLRNKCLEPVGGLYYFCKVVLGYKALVPHYHLEFANKIQSSARIQRRGFLRPRGHFKSTIAAKSYPLWRLCGGGRVPGSPDPRLLRFLIAGEAAEVAQKDIKDPSWNIQNNQLLRALFPEIIPADFNKVAWRADAIEIQRPSSFDEASITSAGVGAKLTGTHYDCIIYDDIIGEKAAKSEAVMQEAREWFDYAPGLANDPHTVEELIIGTRWKHGAADLYGYIMKELEFSEESGRPSGFEWDVEGCYDSNGDVRFTPRFDHEILTQILKRERIYKFSCQYLNQPCAPEGTQFREEQLKTFKIGTSEDGKRDLLIPSDGTPPVRLTFLSRLSFYDPSSGGKFAGSENAIACVGTASDGRRFAFKIWSQNCGFRGAVEEWFKINDRYITWPNMFEGVGPHKEVASIVTLRQEQMALQGFCALCDKEGKRTKHRRLSPVCVTPPGGAVSKIDRILTFCQADIEDGLVYLREDDVETKAQIVGFPLSELIDRFDALAYAIHYSKRPYAPEEIEAQEHEKAQKDASKMQRTAQTYEVGGYV
jgi:hypothetical protein